MISIIIPMFNAQNTIESTLNSINTDHHDLIEIICIDDGSTDNTLKKAQEWAETSALQIKVVAQINKGAAAARNHGIKISSFRYILFLDSDDIFAEGAINHFIELLLTYSGYDVYMGQILHFTDNTLIPISTHRFKSGPSTLENQPALLQSIGPAAKLYDKYKLTQKFDEDITFCEEHTFNVSAFSQNVFVSLKPVYLYTIGNGSSVTQNVIKTNDYLQDALIVRERVWQKINNRVVWDYYSYRMDELIVSYLIKRTLIANMPITMNHIINYLNHMITTDYNQRALSRIINFILIYGDKTQKRAIISWCRINDKHKLIQLYPMLFLKRKASYLIDRLKRVIK